MAKKLVSVRARSTATPSFAAKEKVRDAVEVVPTTKNSVGGAMASGAATVPASRLKSSSLLDTRVIYCGDNLEQLAKVPDACARRMQKAEGRMVKPAHSGILPSSFNLLPFPCYQCDWHASHYVKVMPDQILGENKFSKWSRRQGAMLISGIHQLYK